MTIGATCTNYEGASVTIDAPASGTVVVEADVWIKIDHTNGTRDTANICLDQIISGCSALCSNIENVADDANNSYYHEVHLKKEFIVSAGTTTFSINGRMMYGQDAGDQFASSDMTAVYYPY